MWNGSILKGGLLAGLVINLVDVPNSILFGAPLLERQLAAWGVKSHPAMPPYFVALHFVLGIALVWVARKLMDAGLRRPAATLGSVTVLVGMNRLFGFGNVLIGSLGWMTFLVFSWSFIVGSTLGCVAGVGLSLRGTVRKG
jgi:hypothetical protein